MAIEAVFGARTLSEFSEIENMPDFILYIFLKNELFDVSLDIDLRGVFDWLQFRELFESWFCSGFWSEHFEDALDFVVFVSDFRGFLALDHGVA